MSLSTFGGYVKKDTDLMREDILICKMVVTFVCPAAPNPHRKKLGPDCI